MKHVKDARIAFFGTPVLATYVLNSLRDAHIYPDLIVTAPDRPAGRKLQYTAPPVKVWADEKNIPTFQPEHFTDAQAVDVLANTQWDLFIVAAYNMILPKWMLDLPTFGVLNVHPSLLPKNRGPSPIRSAILDDNKDAIGVSVIQLDEKMDHGPLVGQATVELPEWPVPGNQLDAILFTEGGRLLGEIVPEWLRRTITPEPQEHDCATYTKKIKKADGEIALDADGYKNYLKYCAFDGWPGVFFFHNDKRVKITDAEYRDGRFVVRKVVPEGKKEMMYDVWHNNQTQNNVTGA